MSVDKPIQPDFKEDTTFAHHENGDENGSMHHIRSDGIMDLRGAARKKAERKLKLKLDFCLVL